MTSHPWEPAQHPPAFLPAEIHVWRIDLERIAAPGITLLAADEATRAARLRYAQHRTRFIAGRCALRILLGEYLDTPAGELRFRYGTHGKPALVPVRTGASLHFNFSNSDLKLVYIREMCLCGLQ